MPEKNTTHFGFQTIPSDLKEERVASVFHSVAKRYDLMNDLMSFGLHRLWKRFAISRCAIRPDDYILDLAGGTGDLTSAFSKLIGANGKIVLADINSSMLTEGRTRLIDKGVFRGITWIQANAQTLPFANQSFDKVAIAFGLRNVTDKDKALEEMYRILKPGGRLVILEFSHVHAAPIKSLYDAYSFKVLPKLGKWVCQDEESYQYLAESIRMHPDQKTLKSMMENAGFEKCDYQDLNAGIVALHCGFKF